MDNKDLLTVMEVDIKVARNMISRYHYLGSKGFRGGYNYGLFLNNKVIGVAIFHNLSSPETAVGAFGASRNEQEGFLELGRLVLDPEFNGRNYGSFFLSKCIRELKKRGFKYLISYASSDLHNGAIYQSSNWKYYGLSDEKKDFYVMLNGELKKQERGKTKGIEGVWVNRPVKHRYAYQLDKRVDILWEEKPYPKKRDTLEVCYGCSDTGVVKDKRFDKEYSCPICKEFVDNN